MTNDGAVALAKVAKRLGLTQADIAREIEVSAESGYVTRLMNGERTPSLKVALRIQAKWPEVKATLWASKAKAA